MSNINEVFTLDELMEKVEPETEYLEDINHPQFLFQPGWYKKETNCWVCWRKNIYKPALVTCVERKANERVWLDVCEAE